MCEICNALSSTPAWLILIYSHYVNPEYYFLSTARCARATYALSDTPIHNSVEVMSKASVMSCSSYVCNGRYFNVIPIPLMVKKSRHKE